MKIYEKSEEEVESLLGQLGLNSYDKTIFATFKITIDRIKQSETEESKLSREILDIIAYLAPDSIPKETFLELAQNSVQENDAEIRDIRAKGKLNRAIHLLEQYSMVNLELEQDQLSIHRLVQQVIKSELKKEEKEVEVLKETLGLLKNVW